MTMTGWETIFKPQCNLKHSNPCHCCDHLMLVEDDNSDLGEAFCNHPDLNSPMFICYATILGPSYDGYELRYWGGKIDCPMNKW